MGSIAYCHMLSYCVCCPGRLSCCVCCPLQLSIANAFAAMGKVKEAEDMYEAVFTRMAAVHNPSSFYAKQTLESYWKFLHKQDKRKKAKVLRRRAEQEGFDVRVLG